MYYLDFLVKPNSKFQQKIPAGWNCFAYTLSGKIFFDSKEVDAHNTVVFDKGDFVEFENKVPNVIFLFITLRKLFFILEYIRCSIPPASWATNRRTGCAIW